MSKQRILIVDDEKDMVYAVKMQLEAKDFNVLAAFDGQTGLELARKEKPDLIILDVMLPKIDGYKVCRILKFDEKYKNIPILMFTARVQTGDEKQGYDVGADAYITKPYEPESLMKHIKMLLKDKHHE